MIYTTYFAKLKQLPEDVVPIAICTKPPVGVKCPVFRQLAPKYDFFKYYKVTGDTEYFTKCYNEQILNWLNPALILDALYREAGVSPITSDIALVCYEKPSDFCHRQLVAEWFNKNGIPCKEYKYQ